MQCLGDVLTKTLPYNVLDDVLKKPKHRACNAYSNVFMMIFGNRVDPQWNQEAQVHPMQQALQSKY